jgi:hypothetical protein
MSADYRKLVEGARALIIDYIQTNIAANLTIVAAAVGPPQVTLEVPQSYFIFEKPHGYELPAVFVICDNFDFRIQDKKSNFVNASAKFKVCVLVEDQDEENLTYKVDRYLSAMHQTLDETQILSMDGSLNIIIVVYRVTFSPIFTREEGSGDGGKFRKEIVLECEVEHIENF